VVLTAKVPPGVGDQSRLCTEYVAAPGIKAPAATGTAPVTGAISPLTEAESMSDVVAGELPVGLSQPAKTVRIKQQIIDPALLFINILLGRQR
jgi:hypothetical protein